MPIKNQYKKCNNCKQIIHDMTITKCPKCGLDKFGIVIEIEDSINISDSLRGKMKDPKFSSKKNPRVEFITGTEMCYDKNKLVQKERLIDKNRNLYKEKIIDRETGKTMYTEEPLDQHTGHGSDKYKKIKRCDWPGSNKLMIKYHDEEWGVPNHDDRKWFEYITLDAFQAGLSWSIVLNKRKNFRKAFDNFNPNIISKYNQLKIDELIQDTGIIRNKLKINATISNAIAFLDVQKEFGTFDNYIWRFVNGKPIVNKWKTTSEIPASISESDILSKDLKSRGFKFVGTTICYAFMQSAGMVNDHLITCFRYKELQ